MDLVKGILKRGERKQRLKCTLVGWVRFQDGRDLRLFNAYGNESESERRAGMMGERVCPDHLL